MAMIESFPMLLELLGAEADYPGYCRWLDRQLVGPGLEDLIGRFQSLTGNGTPTRTLEDILGAGRAAVEAEGLGALSPATLSRLLSEPHLLLDLQECVLLAGSPYWDELAARTPTPLRAPAGLQSQTGNMVREAAGNLAQSTVTPPSRRDAGGGIAGLGRRQWWSVVAAGVALGVLWLWPSASPRGWQREGLWTADGSPADYLRQLSRAAGDYEVGEEASAAETARALTEVLAGCDRLLAADHRQLATATDRETLNAACQRWKERFVDQQARLRQDPGQLAEERTKFNQTLAAMRNMLNTWAETGRHPEVG